MKRKIVNKLINWKNSTSRQPLLLQGARQVGKTYTLLSFGKEHYKNVAYFSLEDSTEIQRIFERDLKPERIIKELAARSGISILPGDTLVIFDEIQACDKALTSLKYFAENAPEYHIAAAGSLLGVALGREKYSFPVGKVQNFTLHPMDFDEFLQAMGQQNLSEFIRESYEDFTPLLLHDTAMDYYRQYLAVGGMPRAVEEYAKNCDFDFVTAIQKNLNDSYIADMAKYATPQETVRIIAAWASVPAQLAKDNKKFQYKVIKSGARASEYAVALDWLTAAGMINKCDRVTEGSYPLSVYARNDTFKVYMHDCGLLCSKSDIAPKVIVDMPHSFDGFKGAIAENYIMEALIANGKKPYYWESDGKAEVDFVIQNGEDIIPVEVKSGTHTRSRSLNEFIKKYNPPYAIRISAKNFGYENNIKSVPLYAVYLI
ncbi:MAG: ATP-binding protein [Ruminococcus sp.]|jgi:predicted AAA+ superfamily ATPase|nr:ATP-binding protein [Ruminococcus sp.]